MQMKAQIVFRRARRDFKLSRFCKEELERGGRAVHTVCYLRVLKFANFGDGLGACHCMQNGNDLSLATVTIMSTNTYTYPFAQDVCTSQQ